jgi:hypothetical protein
VGDEMGDIEGSIIGALQQTKCIRKFAPSDCPSQPLRADSDGHATA